MKKFFTSYGRLVTLWSAKLKIIRSPQLVLLACLLIFSTSVFAQGGKIQGTVLDEKGDSMPGVSIVIKGTNYGTVTDVAGNFSINADKGATLIFSFVSYNKKEVIVGGQKTLTVKLTPSSSNLDEVVVVGYGTQKKATLTTAVSSINNSDIVTTKNENVENMLTGKIAGLQVVQNTSEPGQFDNSIHIRSYGNNPLIVIDGIEQPDFSVTGGTGDNSSGTSNILSRLDPNDIESVSVLKDASAAVYGINGANGVILITTKKGKSGTMQLTYSGTFGLEVPSGLPKPVGAIDYMTLANQQSMHNSNGGRLIFSPADFAAYSSGTKQSTDWFDQTFKKSAFQDQHNLTATGGNDNTTYMISGGFTGQDGLLQSNDLNYKRYNVRSNITSKVTKNLTVNLNLSAIMDQTKAPSTSVWYTTREAWRELPTQTLYANNNPLYMTNGSVDGGNPIAYGDANTSGYNLQNNRFFSGLLSLDYKVPFVPGLDIKASYSYNTQIQDNKQYIQTYSLYDYDAAKNLYNASVKNSPGSVQRQYYNYPQNTDQLSLNYDHTFNKVHNVTALLLYEGNDRSEDNFSAYRQLSLPVDQIFAGNSLNQNANQDGGGLYHYASNSLVGRLHYDYKGKYLAEFSFRNDESSKFAPKQPSAFFPSGSAAWNISEEDFWKNSKWLSFIDQFKIRASYAVLGDDEAENFQFIEGYNYPAGGSNNQVPSGAVFGNSFVNSVGFTSLANPNITFETAHTFDVGVDIDAWKGLLGLTVDYYKRDRYGLFIPADAIVSEVLGVGLPQQNAAGDRSEGFEVELSHVNHIGQFRYNIKGTFSLARASNRQHVESPQGNSYLDWLSLQTNRYQGIQFGLGGSGQFQNYQQILNSPTFVNRNTVVGDYNYQDWNGDGQIDGNDNHPIAYTGTPVITYGLNLGGSYKNLDFNLLFQGTGIVDVSYIEQLNIPLWGGGSALTQFLDDYHPTNPSADPYNPNTAWTAGHFAYTGTTANTGSTFNFQSAAYVRLKNAQIGYTLPKPILKTIGVKSVRIFANGYNLLTFTKLKYVDPEHPSGTYGYLYPLDKLFNAGIDVKF
ncbi:MAG: SusC/RagA family TonB-linked outer membrane protein [Sphingobacteriales bacterium]